MGRLLGTMASHSCCCRGLDVDTADLQENLGNRIRSVHDLRLLAHVLKAHTVAHEVAIVDSQQRGIDGFSNAGILLAPPCKAIAVMPKDKQSCSRMELERLLGCELW